MEERLKALITEKTAYNAELMSLSSDLQQQVIASLLPSVETNIHPSIQSSKAKLLPSVKRMKQRRTYTCKLASEDRRRSTD